MFYWTAEPTTAQGPRKGELSSASMRHRLRPQPARLVRGSSRRIMTMRFRPANIRVINRRICSWDDHRPYCPKQNTLKAHQRERVPATPPVDWSWGARTVRAVKGSFRRAKKAARLDHCAPFRPDNCRGGRLRREHFAALHTSKNKRPASLLRRKAGQKTKQNPSDPVGLDRSLHIRSGTAAKAAGYAHRRSCSSPS